MAADYIVVNKTNRPPLGTQLIRAANDLKAIRELVDGLNDIAGHQVNGGDVTMFESQFGVTNGANVVTLLGLINTILNTNGSVVGTDRLSQIDEFVGRLAGQ